MEYLRSIFEETKYLYSDEDLGKLGIDVNTFDGMLSRVDLDFDHTNREEFGAEEAVRLTVEVKNVPTLYVKVFEINLLNYYKKEEAPSSAPTSTWTASWPTTSRRSTYKQPPEPQAHGGVRLPRSWPARKACSSSSSSAGGKSSRAIVKKGKLTLVHRTTIAGHIAYILDDQQQICTGQEQRPLVRRRVVPRLTARRGAAFSFHTRRARSPTWPSCFTTPSRT